MSGLPLQCAALVGWVVCLAQLDHRWERFELGAASYLLLAIALAILAVPALRRVSTVWALALIFPAFVALELATTPMHAANPVGSLLEFAGVGIAIALACRLARRFALAEDVLSELALGTLGETAPPFARVQGEMFREVRRARRYERPLSLLAVSARGPQPPPALAQLLEEARRASLSRLVNLKVGTLLDDQTAGSAVIAERDGHYLLLLPEAGRQEAERVAKRLEQAAVDRHGIGLRFGIASFPHQEITFDKLLETAETDLRAVERATPGAEQDQVAAARIGSSTPARS